MKKILVFLLLAGRLPGFWLPLTWADTPETQPDAASDVAFTAEAETESDTTDPHADTDAEAAAATSETAESEPAPEPDTGTDEHGIHRAAHAWPENPRIFIIPVDQPIMQLQQILFRRGIRRARAEKVDAVILLMDTPGGRVDIMRSMTSNIIDLGIPTYTLVLDEAISAGAIIALSTDHIFMTPSSVIGDAMPVMMAPGGGMQELGEAEREKIESYMDSVVRSIAQAKGRDEMLIRAMVRRELHYELEDGTVISKAGNILTLTNLEAEQLRPDGSPLLSEGTVSDLDEMLALLGLENAEVLREEATWADNMALFLTRIAPFLLTLAILFFYIEANSPGIGWMGGLSLVFFLIVMFGHNVAGLAGMEDILLIIIGMLLILVEILLIPGFGFVGLTGILLFFGGLIRAMIIRYPGNPGNFPGLDNFGNIGPATTNLSISVIASLILLILLMRTLEKSKFANKKLILNTSIGGGARDNPLMALVGQTGIALTPLGPSGTVDLNGKEYSVVTDGSYLESGAGVRVTDIHGNRIIVRPGFPETSDPSQEQDPA